MQLNESKTNQKNPVGIRKQILIDEAVEWLQKRNKKLGVHFDYDNALEVANNLAFIEKVKEVQDDNIIFIEKGITDGFFIFHGNDNCKASCRGWDGKSDRCDCGERRIEWDCDYSDDYFKNPTCFGRAR